MGGLSVFSYIWILPVAITAIIAFVIYRAFKPIMQAQAKQKRLLQTGVQAPARVLGLQPTGRTLTVGGHRQPQVRLSVEVHPSGGSPYQAVIVSFISEFQIAGLQPGATVQVRYDRMDKSQVALEAIGGAPIGSSGLDGVMGSSQPSSFGSASLPDAINAPNASVGTPIQPMATTPVKKSGAGMIVILGVMLALGGVGAAMFFVTKQTSDIAGDFATEKMEQLKKADDKAATTPTDPADKSAAASHGSGSAAVEAEATSTTGDVCAKAAACCEAIAKKGNSGSAANCKGFTKMPASACKASLQGFEMSAKSLGISCP